MPFIQIIARKFASGLPNARTAWHVLAFICLISATLWGQSTQTLVGTVEDTAGGAIGGATVKVRHLQTGATRESLTNNTGDYEITGLQEVGLFEVRAEFAGFKTAIVPEVTVLTGQKVRVDLRLEVGAITESVTVEAEVPLVRSEVSSLGTVVQNREVIELPLYGRDFLQLATLSPGVSSRAPAGAGYQEANLVIGGSRARDNDFRIDGMRAMANHNADITSRPPLDAIEEFQMLRHQYAAEYGRALGAVVEVRTKSGSNQLHGSAYGFFRRGDWSAIPYFSRTQPVYKENQYGGSIGGPVIHDRTFLFFAYERFSSPSEVLARRYVLTDQEKAGDFSQSIWGASPLDQLTGQPFPNATIPSSRFSPATLSMLQILPGANQEIDAGINWTGNLPNNLIAPNFVIRGDHRINERHSVYMSTIWARPTQYQAPGLDCGTCDHRISDLNLQSNSATMVGGYTWVANPNIVFQARFGYTFRESVYNQIDRSKNWAKEWGFAFAPPDDRPELHGTPRIGPRGFGSYFSNFANPTWGREEPAYNAVAGLSIVSGNHSIRVGADILRDTARGLFACGATGAYTVGYEPRVGNQAAEFLMGVYNFAYYQLTPDQAEGYRWSQGYYLQDDWKIHPKLTLNLGLRYDYFSAYYAPKFRIARYDLVKDEVVYPAGLEGQLSDLTKASLKFPHRFEGPPVSFEDPQKMNLGPRFGLAFRPFGNSDTVVRGGYGIFYGSPQGYTVTRNWRVAPWAAFLTVGTTPAVPSREVMYLDKLIPEFQTTDYTTPGDIRMAERGFHNPYTQHWNLTVQKSLGHSMAVEAGYVGSRSVHLDYEVWGRKLAGLYGREDFWLGQNLHLSTSGNDSNYHALQVTLQRHFSGGLSFRANYTYAKLMNDSAEFFDAPWSGHYAINKRQEWARGQADLRHNVNFSGIYELPFGRGRRFGTGWHRGLDAVLGGWKLNYIVEANSGAPIDVLWGGTFRPDLVSGKTPTLSDPSPNRWFDTSAFQVQGCVAPCQGNVGRDVIEGPNFGNLDLGISKVFAITETHRIDARLEAFNATNHPNMFRGGQQVDVSQPGADRLLNTFPMRRIQVAVRYSF